MENRPFPFTEWSDDHVIGHFHRLRKHLDESARFLSVDRRVQINREITHVAFEGLQREQAKRQREEETAWLEHNFNQESYAA